MAQQPLEFCPKCEKPLTYLKVVRKKDEAEVEAICLDGHKESFKTSIIKRPIWLRFIIKRILSCVKCGNPALPIKDTMKKGKDTVKFKVKCRADHDDKYEREVDTELAEEIKRAIEQFRSRGIKPFSKPFLKPYPKPFGIRFAQVPPASTGTSQEKVKVRYTIPDQCPKCKAPLNMENVIWTGPLEAKCPYCETLIKAKEEEI